jgi:hypothetical protein
MTVSKRPAIGLEFFHKNAKQLVDSGHHMPRYYQKKLEQYYPDLFDEYQERVMTNLKTIGDEEAYAKLVIDTAKMEQTSNELRQELDPLELKRREFFKAQLKTKRDNYVRSTKGN